MTRTIEQNFQVDYRYPVVFTRHAFAPTNSVLREVLDAGRVLVVIDDGVARARPELARDIEAYFQATNVTLVAPPIVLTGGEAVKHEPRNVERVLELVERYGIDRHSYVVAVGGGALIDMVGYAAAIAHRGVRLVRVPTTVLAQNDAAVGVKNSVNAFGKKNFLGTFAPPHAVVNDLEFLTTLEDRDWRAGLAEAVKVALLKDPVFFAFLEREASQLRARDAQAMEHAVYRCAELHLQHIGQGGDPFERGSARPLDFGHWAAHKLEALTNYALRHGEAVAIGIALDTAYSRAQGMLAHEDAERVLRVLEALGLPIYTPELEAHLDEPSDARGVLAGLNEFREHLGGQLTVTLLEAIGLGVEVHDMNLDVLRACILDLKHASGPHKETSAV